MTECSGCRDNIFNQLAHMEIGGCLYQDEYSWKEYSSSSSDDTIEMSRDEIEEFKNRINQRANQVSPTKLYRNNQQKNDLVNDAMINQLRRKWQHKNIYVDHYMDGDTVIII